MTEVKNMSHIKGLDRDLMRQIRIMAINRQVNMSVLINQALADYLKAQS